MPEKKGRKVKLGFAENFMLSGAAAVTSKTAAAPIERIKMVVQNQDEMLKRGTLKEPFKGPLDCGRWIMKSEGGLAFWKSNFTNCLRYFPTQALNFSFKDQVKKNQYLGKNKADSNALKLGKNVAGGGLAGFGSLCFVYSLDYARTRLANDLKQTKKAGEAAGKAVGDAAANEGREFSGLFDVYKKTFASDGIGGLYRGFVISAVGIFIYRGFYFGLYDTIMPFLPDDVNFAMRFGVGYTVTVSAGLLSYPIDTIRRRMMMTSGSAVKYSGSFDCAAQIMKAEGPMSFMKGAGANILRGVAGAGVLAGFDVFKREYVKHRYGADAYL
jgi:solute carrier family 25 (adenine nucleotide translocator) protein 4/5/6/31